jgi:hypothetical protein
MDIVVGTWSDPLSYVPALRNAVLTVDKNLPLANMKTMEQRLGESLVPRRERPLLLGTFAMLAVLIAASGVYGVTAHSVTRRTHEIGVRLAMGASRRDVLRMMMTQGLPSDLLTLVSHPRVTPRRRMGGPQSIWSHNYRRGNAQLRQQDIHSNAGFDRPLHRHCADVARISSARDLCCRVSPRTRGHARRPGAGRNRLPVS